MFNSRTIWRSRVAATLLRKHTATESNLDDQVEENLEKTRKLLEYYDTSAEQQAFIERMIRYFNKERKVTEFTIEKLKALKAGMAGSAAS